MARITEDQQVKGAAWTGWRTEEEAVERNNECSILTTG